MITWIGFATLGSINSTALHFMPLAGSNISPVEVNCRIKLFGLATSPLSIECDGLRVAEPNGIQLNSIFPEAKPKHGEFCAFQLELYSNSKDLDLKTSECIVEMQSSHGTLSYRPQTKEKSTKKREYKIPIFEAKLRNQSISIIATNPFDSAALTNFEQSCEKDVESCNLDDIQNLFNQKLREIQANEVEEIDLTNYVSGFNENSEDSAGILIGAQNMTNTEDNIFSNSMLSIKHLEHPVPLYALYRDKATGKAKMVVDL